MKVWINDRKNLKQELRRICHDVCIKPVQISIKFLYSHNVSWGLSSECNLTHEESNDLLMHYVRRAGRCICKRHGKTVLGGKDENDLGRKPMPKLREY